jgi:hypothetical protein
MKPVPNHVIHIEFSPGTLFFDARPIWHALDAAEALGRVPRGTSVALQQKLGEMAIHLATRFLLMRFAVTELKVVCSTLYTHAPEARTVDAIPNSSVLRQGPVDLARDHLLLMIDSFLFEFRAFLELIAKFAFTFLVEIDRAPTGSVTLLSGKVVRVVGAKGNLNAHNLLLYFCDFLKVAPEWFEFLVRQRNFFTHLAAPYCAIEDRGQALHRYDVLIMRKNILDFSTADPKDYFRVSECDNVIEGTRLFAQALQNYLLGQLT